MNINQVIIHICQYFTTKMDTTSDKAHLTLCSYKDIITQSTLTMNISTNIIYCVENVSMGTTIFT